MATASEAEISLAQTTGTPLVTVQHITRILRTAGDDLWLTTGRGIRNAQVKPHHVVNVALAISNGQPADGVEFVRKFRMLRSESTKIVRERERLNALTMLFADEETKAFEATLPLVETAVSAANDGVLNLGEILDSFVDFLANETDDEIAKSRLWSLNLQIEYYPSLRAALTLGLDPGDTETFFFALPTEMEEAPAPRRIFMRPMILDYLGLTFLSLCLKGFEESSTLPKKEGRTASRDSTT
ncbi:hypothetical protein [Acidisoma silvae]|uniref:Uncharacterized protein n=1 Tax=Acidisoma silvae TaxID=2802396 RepID=A0A963YWI4_9PROT|nr:hypothetical protein [Acidisoma silvae]MCB8878276.1 hypothetical protein [Acidisoma silvae]